MATLPISRGLKVEESARLLHAIFPKTTLFFILAGSHASPEERKRMKEAVFSAIRKRWPVVVDFMTMSAPLSRALWLVGATKVYPGVRADIVMESFHAI